MDAFFAPEVWPFSLAVMLLAIFAVVETLAVLGGVSASHWLDGAAAGLDHTEGFASAVLSWLHIGKVPILALLVMLLTSFAVIGFILQFAVNGTSGYFLPAPLAAGISLVGGISIVRVFGAGLSKIMPKDETTAVSDASLVGRIAVVVIGTASQGNPAEARTRDEHGHTHYVMVEPEEPDHKLESGSSVLLVRQVSGRLFRAIPNPKPEYL